MAKLYPPLIEGVIPAFTGSSITIPFNMNNYVGTSQVSGMVLRIKNIQTDSVLGDDEITASPNFKTNTVTFDISDIVDDLTIGNYYKCQIAFKDTSEIVGYYSSTGVAKYTTTPTVTIDSLETEGVNLSKFNFVGHYSQADSSEGANDHDSSEKVYQYKFVIYDAEENIVYNENYQLHDSSTDTLEYESYDYYDLKTALEEDTIYFIQYIVKTNNGLTCASVKYKISDLAVLPCDLSSELSAELNYEEGYIELKLVNYSSNAGFTYGEFIIERQEDDDWHIIDTTSISLSELDSWSYKDFTIEHHKTYSYSLRQYSRNTGLYSERLNLTRVIDDDYVFNQSTILADFEHTFLYDGERQLKIKFNPKLTNFKTTLLESKIDTIGSKYPYFYRNGNTSYKQFSIGGLISYLADDEELFLSSNLASDSRTRSSTGSEELETLETRTTNIVDYNIAEERRFKLKVLNWLNNGGVKLIKTPTEGNYLIRLMDISLSPQETISRMLHDFSASAYEVAAFNYSNLLNYGFYNTDFDTTNKLTYVNLSIFNKSTYTDETTGIEKDQIDSIKLNYNLLTSNSYQYASSYDSTKEYYQLLSDGEYVPYEITSEDDFNNATVALFYENSVNTSTNYVRFEGFLRGTKVKVNSDIFEIGKNGILEFNSDEDITYISIIKDGDKIEWPYYLYTPYNNITVTQLTSNISSKFDKFKEVELELVPDREFTLISVNEDLDPSTTYSDGSSVSMLTDNLLDLINTTSQSLYRIDSITFTNTNYDNLEGKAFDDSDLDTYKIVLTYDDDSVTKEINIKHTLEENYKYPITQNLSSISIGKNIKVNMTYTIVKYTYSNVITYSNEYFTYMKLLENYNAKLAEANSFLKESAEALSGIDYNILTYKEINDILTKYEIEPDIVFDSSSTNKDLIDYLDKNAYNTFISNNNETEGYYILHTVGGELPNVSELYKNYTYDKYDGLTYSISITNELPVPIKNGYTFLGWYNENGKEIFNGEGYKTYTGTISITSPYRLYAKYEYNFYGHIRATIDQTTNKPYGKMIPSLPVDETKLHKFIAEKTKAKEENFHNYIVQEYPVTYNYTLTEEFTDTRKITITLFNNNDERTVLDSLSKNTYSSFTSLELNFVSLEEKSGNKTNEYIKMTLSYIDNDSNKTEAITTKIPKDNLVNSQYAPLFNIVIMDDKTIIENIYCKVTDKINYTNYTPYVNTHGINDDLYETNILGSVYKYNYNDTLGIEYVSSPEYIDNLNKILLKYCYIDSTGSKQSYYNDENVINNYMTIKEIYDIIGVIYESLAPSSDEKDELQSAYLDYKSKLEKALVTYNKSYGEE